jgi:hypothetical protein
MEDQTYGIMLDGTPISGGLLDLDNGFQKISRVRLECGLNKP